MLHPRNGAAQCLGSWTESTLNKLEKLLQDLGKNVMNIDLFTRGWMKQS